MPCMGKEVCIPHTYSYIVQKPDPLIEWYEAYRDIGNRRFREFQGADASTVIQAAINALPTTDYEGDVFIKRATYDVASDIAIGKRTRLIAEMGTVFNVTANPTLACIVISSLNNEARWGIEGLKIDMNYYDGHAIYSAHASQTGHEGHPTLKNIKIQEIEAGYCGIYLIDPFMISGDNIEIRSNKGTGMKFGINETKTVHFGNSHFSNIFIGVNANNAIGLHIVSGDTYVFCLSTFDRLQVNSLTSYTGNVGVKLEGVQNCKFGHLNIEFCEQGLVLQSTGGNKETVWNEFYSPYIYGCDGDAVYIGNGATRNSFYGGKLGVDAAGNDLIDDNNYFTTYSKYRYNYFNNVNLGTTGDKNLGWASILRDCYNFNPIGIIALPFGTVFNMVSVHPTQGAAALPTTGVTYRVAGVDMLITSTGGTGMDIDIFDPAGTEYISNLATLTQFLLPVGYSIRFTYTGTPTIIVSGI